MYKSAETPKISGSRLTEPSYTSTSLKPIIFDLLKFLTAAVLAVSAGLALSYFFNSELEGSLATASEFFAFFKEDVTFLYKLTILCSKDVFFLVLTSFSALSFICIPLNTCVISVGGFFYGVCMGILIFLKTPHQNAVTYAVAASSVILIFVISSALSRKYNIIFANSKNSKDEFPKLAKAYLQSACPIYVTYIAVKVLLCVWLCL